MYEDYRETRNAIDKLHSNIQEMKEHGFNYPSVEYDIAVKAFDSGNYQCATVIANLISEKITRTFETKKAKTKEMLKNIMNFAYSIDDPSVRVFAICETANLFSKVEENEKAEELLATAEEISEQLESTRHKVWALSIENETQKAWAIRDLIVEIAKMKGIVNEHEIFRRGLEALSDMKNHASRDEILREIALEFSKQGEKTENSFLLEKAYSIGKAIQTMHYRTSVFREIALNLAKLGVLKNHNLIQRALEVADAIEDYFYRMETKREIGFMLASVGIYQNDARIVESAVKIISNLS
ncbi:MAG: hypothetical protein QXJ27_01240 [Thermoplasmata archaeon]